MVKSLISLCCAVALLIGLAVYENDFVSRQFNEFSVVVEELYDKTEKHVATEQDVLSVQQNWLNKKKYLHIFIPHTEIKEMELWLSEAVSLVRDEKWDDAISKIEVLKELAEQIPKSFMISIENIM